MGAEDGSGVLRATDPRPASDGDLSAVSDQDWRRAERSTWLVAVAIYGAWLLLTWFYAALPWWLVLPLGGLVVAWHGSLQHECVHGHPTSVAWVNELLAFPSLWLWLPYRVYRESHLAHHDCARLTCPVEDPESFYLSPEAWRAMGRLRRALYVVRMSLMGRLVLGPLFAVQELAAGELGRLSRGDLAHLRHWAVHAASVLLVLAWTGLICGIPLWQYVLLFAYPGLSLTLLRSYAEHRPARTEAERTVVVEAGPLFSLLYLNNNLHTVHHRWPDLPWRLVGRLYWAERHRLPAGMGHFRFPGYGAVARRFLWRVKDSPEHPGFGPQPAARPAAPVR